MTRSPPTDRVAPRARGSRGTGDAMSSPGPGPDQTQAGDRQKSLHLGFEPGLLLEERLRGRGPREHLDRSSGHPSDIDGITTPIGRRDVSRVDAA